MKNFTMKIPGEIAAKFRQEITRKRSTVAEVLIIRRDFAGKTIARTSVIDFLLLLLLFNIIFDFLFLLSPPLQRIFFFK